MGTKQETKRIYKVTYSGCKNSQPRINLPIAFEYAAQYSVTQKENGEIVLKPVT